MAVILIWPAALFMEIWLPFAFLPTRSHTRAYCRRSSRRERWFSDHFVGIDDQLRAVKLGAKIDSFTIVLVAAPRQNTGAFAAFTALNGADERDYTSGLNVDLGPTASGQFSVLNVEGRGFGGAQNLR